MCKQGQIYTLPVEYTDQPYTETRPVLIISKNSLIKGRKDILVATISKTMRALRDENSIAIENNQITGDGLEYSPSAIQAAKIVNTHKMWLDKYVGEVDKEILESVLEKVRSIFVTE